MNTLAVIFPANQYAPPVGPTKEDGDLETNPVRENGFGVAASLSQQYFHFKE